MSKKIVYSLFIGIAFAMVNCISLSSYKTAKAMGENPGGGRQVSMRVNATAYNAGGDTLWVPEVMFRGAVIPEVMDLGIKAYPFGLEGDLKLQFVRGKFNMALDAAFSYTQITAGSVTYSQIGIQPSLLITYDVAPGFSFTLAPKVIYLIGTLSVDTSVASTASIGFDSGLMYGGHLTLDLGQDLGLMPEVGYFVHENGGSLITGGVAIRFGGYTNPGG